MPKHRQVKDTNLPRILRMNLPRNPFSRWRLRGAFALAAIAALAPPAIATASVNPENNPPECQAGQFCVWNQGNYSGETYKFDLRTTNPEQCVPIPENVDATSFINRMDRSVTVYQDRQCATEADFSTYPGGGTYVPHTPYVVRAIQVWQP